MSNQQQSVEIPVPYLVSKLHEMGSMFYNDPSTAYAELNINEQRTFFIHKEYLEFQSNYFCDIFTKKKVKKGDLIKINLPSPDTFEIILEFFYFGDEDRFYDKLNIDNYYDVMKNVNLLGLSSEIKNICLAFYQDNREFL
nr:11718_t:CDS:1 [Entrophospora candida]CAG8440444.1 11059_t:CDS:1 [Entrophospora candida]